MNGKKIRAHTPERPMASALLEELKIVATEAKRSQIEDAVGSSWAALAAEEDPQGRGIGTLLVEAGAGGGGGGGGGRERGGGERGGRGGGGVGQREQWEDPMATQSDREIELSQTNRRVGGVCVGVVPCVQSNLSRALHAHRGKKLLQDLQTQESAATKRAMVRFRGAWEKGAMAFVECLGFSQEDTMEGPLWRETLGTIGGGGDGRNMSLFPEEVSSKEPLPRNWRGLFGHIPHVIGDIFLLSPPPLSLDCSAGAWGRMMRRNWLVGCVMTMVAGKKPSASTPYLAQRRDGALSPTIGCSTRH